MTKMDVDVDSFNFSRLTEEFIIKFKKWGILKEPKDISFFRKISAMTFEDIEVVYGFNAIDIIMELKTKKHNITESGIRRFIIREKGRVRRSILAFTYLYLERSFLIGSIQCDDNLVDMCSLGYGKCRFITCKNWKEIIEKGIDWMDNNKWITEKDNELIKINEVKIKGKL